MFLDEDLNFSYHIKEKMSKAMRGKGVIKKLSKTLPRHALMTTYKLFVRTHGNIIYDQPNYESCNQKIEWTQCNAGLSITDAIKETSQSKLLSDPE